MSIYKAIVFFVLLVGVQTEIFAVDTIRVGVLKYGSAHWVIDTLKRHKLDQSNDLLVEVVEYASVKSLSIALQANAVDTVVSDWLWVAKQYSQQRDFIFYPYSTSAGGLLVPPKSGIKNPIDLQDKRLGVAGSPKGKSWLLFKALFKIKYDIDLLASSDVKFVTPPLLNILMKKKEFDASINYWNFNAVLLEQGYQEIISFDELLRDFGINQATPMLGWIFKESWANNNKNTINKFIIANNSSNKILKESDKAWQSLNALMKNPTNALLLRLREKFIKGIPEKLTEAHVIAMRQLYARLVSESSVFDLQTTNSDSLPNKLFWLNEGNK